MMKFPGYIKTLSPDYIPDCCVCSHDSQKTIQLLKEYDLPFARDLILNNNYCTPIFTFSAFKDILVLDAISPDGRKMMKKIAQWNKAHQFHLKTLRTKGTKRKLKDTKKTLPHKKQKLTHE